MENVSTCTSGGSLIGGPATMNLNLQVRGVKNGFIVSLNYVEHVVKTKEELVTLITELLK